VVGEVNWQEYETKAPTYLDVIVDVPTAMREVPSRVESATVEANLFTSPLLKYFGGLYVHFGLASQNVGRIQTALGRDVRSNLTSALVTLEKYFWSKQMCVPKNHELIMKGKRHSLLLSTKP
jgi:hypothetical protein